MTKLTTRSIDAIERRMDTLEEDSIRRRILGSAKNFKTSWVELGQALYSVWKERLYKDWGYATFEAYTQKEIGIKKMTAMKLLKSYYFLEREEPLYLQKGYTVSREAAQIPGYETVNVLRLARNKKLLDKDDYGDLKKKVFDMGRDASDVRKDLVSLLKQREELEPEEARRARRVAMIKRVLTALRTLKTDLENSKLLPMTLIKDTASLINRIEAEL